MLSTETIVFLFIFSRDKTGRVFSHEENLRNLMKYVKVPIYAVWEFYLGNGIMGGKLTSGKAEGKMAGEMALRILRGEKASDISLEESPTQYMFDYQQLHRFNIEESSLPESSILINKPFSFYQTYKQLIWGAIFIVTILLFIVFILVISIAQRKKTEEALVQSEKKYRLLAENATDVIWTTDMDLNVTYVSPSAQRGIGYTIEETISQSVEKLLTHESFNIATQVLAEEIEIENKRSKSPLRSRTLEFEFRHKNGSTRWSETKLSFIRDLNEKAIGILGVGRDITERKVMEEEKKKLETQLVQAQKMEAIGSLAGGIAHDFNNILSAIIGYTELLQMDMPERNRVSGYVDQILKAGNRAKDLVQQILTFSRQTEQELKPVSVKFIAKEALKLLRATLPTTIHIEQNIKSDSLVMGDPTQIHQLLMNLCTNAGHAMQEKGGILGVELTNIELDPVFASRHPDLKPGPYLNLTVSDTGHGIPSDVMDRIYDPFFTTKERGKGTGMGLAVVHGIVKSYGGTIYTYSEPEKGSSFKVFLPVIASSLGTDKRMEEPIPKGNERILFIDDENVLADMEKQTLESLGYQVVTRTSSVEALNLFRAQPDRFDLVITDMTMPQMTGDKLAEELIAIRKEIPVILCTGFSYGMTKEKAGEMGIKGFLMKPFVVRDLANKIRKVLDK